jgi:hypothetical protein
MSRFDEPVTGLKQIFSQHNASIFQPQKLPIGGQMQETSAIDQPAERAKTSQLGSPLPSRKMVA